MQSFKWFFPSEHNWVFLFPSDSLHCAVFLYLPPLLCPYRSQLPSAAVVRCSRVFSVSTACFRRFSAQFGSSALWGLGLRARRRDAHGGKRAAHSLRVFSCRSVSDHLPPDDARRRCCSSSSEERFCQRTAVPCVVGVFHFYAAVRQPRRPLIKRRHMQLKSTLPLHINVLGGDAAAYRLWISTGDQQTRIGGRFYNACKSYLLNFDT